MSDDVFNMEDTSDLPADLVRDLVSIRKSDLEVFIIGLFDLSKKLTLDQIQVGLYRVHGVSIKRKKLIALLYKMKTRNKSIEKVKGTKDVFSKAR